MKKLLFVAIASCLINYIYSQSTGLLFTDDDLYSNEEFTEPSFFGKKGLDSSFDLSTWFPEPKDQGDQASCVGWALSYGLRSYLENKKYNITAGEKYKFSPSFLYYYIKQSDCDSGANFTDGLNFLKESGVSLYQEHIYDPNNCDDKPKFNIRRNAKKYKISAWNKVDFRDEVLLKAQIYSGNPIVIGMYIDKSFNELEGNMIYNGPSGDKWGHAMLIIGYDDSRQAFRVFNSAGTSWGNKGYGWISYSAVKEYVLRAYIIHISDESNGVNQVFEGINESIEIKIGTPQVFHNQRVYHPAHGFNVGMVVKVSGNVLNGKNKYCQIVGHVFDSYGNQVRSVDPSYFYKDYYGFAAMGSKKNLLNSNRDQIDNYLISIPYHTFSPRSMGYPFPRNYFFQLSIYINDQLLKRTEKIPFYVYW